MTTDCTSAECILINLLLSGLLGLIGQGIRVIVGLKKLHEEAAAENAPNPKAAFDEKFDVRQLWLSLFIGFIAGCLANMGRPKGEFTPEVQLAIIATGYAGADFIEGFLQKILPR